MGSNDIPIPRIQLPLDWSPVGVTCAVVPIPDDPQYASMLVGLLDMLRWSALYARDPTASGAATVARTWAAALNSAPVQIAACDAIGGTVDFRQNPMDNCQLEYSTDGGTTWLLAFDYSLCPPRVVTEPDTSTPDKADAVAGDIIKLFYIYIIHTINVDIYNLVLKATTINNITNILQPYNPSADLGPGLDAAYDHLNDLPTQGDREAYEEDCAWADIWSQLSDFLSQAPGWLDDLSTWLMNGLDDASDALMDALNEVAAEIGGDGVSDFVRAMGGGGGGAGFGGNDCTWHEVLDFTLDDHSFWHDTEGSYDVPAGVYIPGQGWGHSDYTRLSNSWRERGVNVRSPVSSRAYWISRIDITYALTKGTFNANTAEAGGLIYAGNRSGLKTFASHAASGTGIVLSWVPNNLAIKSFAVWLRCGAATTSAGWSGSCTLNQVDVYGYGFNPFA